MELITNLGGTAYKVDGNAITLEAIEHGLTLKTVGDEQYYEAVTGFPNTLLVQLHSWSGTKDECLSSPALAAVANCVWVCPHFGGPNNHPEGANHPAQMERIKRVIDKAKADWGMSRVILCGASGGAGTAWALLGTYPGIAQGATTWVGYHDLAAWWTENANHRGEIEACLGGTPAQLPSQYLARSPKGLLPNARDCIVYVNGGQLDTEIPPHHSADAATQMQALAGMTVHYDPGAGRGHMIDYPTAVAQINAMIAAT